MKISWGTGILIVILVFMAASISMTVYFMNQDVHLVTDNYYEKELVYQQQIDKMQRTYDLNEEVKMKFNGSIVTLIFPGAYLDNSISGELYFYRPSDPNKDFKLPLQINEEGNQVIPVKGLEKGFWRLKLNWTMEGNDYYNERAININ